MVVRLFKLPQGGSNRNTESVTIVINKADMLFTLFTRLFTPKAPIHKGTEKVYAMHKYCIKRRFFSYFVI